MSYRVEAEQLDIVVKPLLLCRLFIYTAPCHDGIAKVGTKKEWKKRSEEVKKVEKSEVKSGKKK